MKRYASRSVWMFMLALGLVATGARAQQALDRKAAVALAQAQAEEAYGAVSLKGAEPYTNLGGAVAAWGVEFYSAEWKSPVGALVAAGQGVEEPTVRTWTGPACQNNAGLLAKAALAVQEKLKVKVSLPEKYLYLGERGLWAQYPEKTPAGATIWCNLADRRVATTPAELQAAAAPRKASLRGKPLSDLPGFSDGSIDYPDDEDIIWYRGQSYDVEWSDFDDSSVVIELWRGSKLVKRRETDNDGVTSWKVENNATLASNYRFKIYSEDNPFDYDWSDHNFTIASNKYKVLSPNEEDLTWRRGATYTIQWSGFQGDKVRIELYLGSLLVEDHTTANDGRYDWEVDDRLASSDDYRIRICEEDNSSHSDWSDTYFEIKGSSARVDYPSASGIVWKRGKTYKVQWSGFDGDDVRIELWRNNSLKAVKIAENDGEVSWKMSSSLNRSSDYKIRISSVEEPWQYDWSDKKFRIE